MARTVPRGMVWCSHVPMVCKVRQGRYEGQTMTAQDTTGKGKGKGQTDTDKARDAATVAQDAPQTDALRMDARTLALLIGDPQDSAHGLGLGRKVNDKRVRSVARDTVDRFVNRTGYTAHAYTVAEARAIVDAMAGKGRGAPTVNADAVRAALTAQDA